MPQWLICTRRSTMPAATFGCWFGGVLSPWRGDPVPEGYQDLIRRLAGACRFISGELEARRLPTAARDQLREIGEASADLQLTGSISAVVILAQTRSMVVDLIQLTGMDYHDARELIPDDRADLVIRSPMTSCSGRSAAGDCMRFG